MPHKTNQKSKDFSLFVFIHLSLQTAKQKEANRRTCKKRDAVGQWMHRDKEIKKKNNHKNTCSSCT